MEKPKHRTAHVKQHRDVRIHSELWHTANCLLKAGQRTTEGSTHQFRASLVFRAFYLEALLNWIGPQLIPHWKYLERLRPQEKLNLLADLIQTRPDYSSRPWQIVRSLFEFRNAMAHGKPENLQSHSEEDLDEVLNDHLGVLQARWESFGTQENAIRAKVDVEIIAKLLYKEASLKHEGPLGPFSFGFHSRQVSL